MVWFTPPLIPTHMLPSLFCLILIPLKIYCTATHGVLQSENLLKLFLPSLQGRACAPSVLCNVVKTGFFDQTKSRHHRPFVNPVFGVRSNRM